MPDLCSTLAKSERNVNAIIRMFERKSSNKNRRSIGKKRLSVALDGLVKNNVFKINKNSIAIRKRRSVKSHCSSMTPKGLQKKVETSTQNKNYPPLSICTRPKLLDENNPEESFEKLYKEISREDKK